MSDLQGTPGELRFTVQVKRKATGKVETFDLVGHVTAEQAQALGLTEQQAPQPEQPEEP